MSGSGDQGRFSSNFQTGVSLARTRTGIVRLIRCRSNRLGHAAGSKQKTLTGPFYVVTPFLALPINGLVPSEVAPEIEPGSADSKPPVLATTPRTQNSGELVIHNCKRGLASGTGPSLQL
jgi:hypothetical protein